MRCSFAAVMVVLACFVPCLQAQTATWIGPATGSWNDPANWSTGVVPDEATFVRIDGGATQNSTVSALSGGTARWLQVSEGDHLILDREFRLGSIAAGQTGTLTGPGTIQLRQGPLGASLVATGTINMTGGGTLLMEGFPGVGATFMISISDYSVIGTGSISAAVLNTSSTSVIEARNPSGTGGFPGTLFVRASVDAVNNTGTLAAAQDATLTINTTTLNSSSGFVYAKAGGTVSFDRDILLNGGTYLTSGGVIVAQPSTGNNRIELRNLNNAGLFRSYRADTLITGTFNNLGTLSVETPGAVLRIGAGTTTVRGGGTIVLAGVSLLGAATATLDHAGHTIAGYTTAEGINVGTLLNGTGGVIDANVTGQRLTLAPMVGLSNAGTLLASNGGELLVAAPDGTVDNRFGTIAARGAGSRVLMDRSTRLFGGAIATDGAGEVVFDASADTLTLDNVINLGRLRVQSGSLAGGADGAVFNAGTLTLGDVTAVPTLTLNGTGQVSVAGKVTSTGQLTNNGNRISGVGEVMGLFNGAGGIVDAATPGGTLQLSNTRGNRGLMRASNGGILRISSVDNSLGRIEAAAGSRVVIDGAVNGTLAALAGGSFVSGSGSSNHPPGITLLGPGTFDTNTTGFRLLSGGSVAFGDNPILNNASLSVTGPGPTGTGPGGVATVNLVGPTPAVTWRGATLPSATATLNIAGAGTLNLEGTISNRGHLVLGAGTAGNVRIVPVGTGTLSGGGTILGAGGATGGGRLVNLDNSVYLDSTGFGLWDGGWENYGALLGRGEASELRFRDSVSSANRGVISAASGRLSVVGSDASNVTGPPVLDNLGGVILSGGGTLTLNTGVINNGTLDARSGLITAAAGGSIALREVKLDGAGLTTGTGNIRIDTAITLGPDGAIDVGGPTLNAGRLLMTFGQTGRIAGQGQIRVFPGGRIGTGFVPGVDLDGGTTFELSGPIIVGAGDVGSGELSMVNDSAVIARALPGTVGPAVMSLRPGSRGIVNNGLIAAEAGTRLILSPGLLTPSFSAVRNTAGSISVAADGFVRSELSIEGGSIFNDGTFEATRMLLGLRLIEGTGHLEGIGDRAIIDARRLRQQSLVLRNSAFLRIRDLEGPSRLTVLTLESGSRFNVGDGALLLDYSGASPFDEIRAHVISGYGGGTWNGSGIITDRSSFGPRTGVGYAEATDLGLAGGDFQGLPVDNTAILLRGTLMGDTDLDKTVGLADFSRLALNFNRPALWFSGDFDYDGTAGISDFALLAGNYNRTLAREAPAGTVPEPIGGLTAAAGVMAMLATRRR